MKFVSSDLEFAFKHNGSTTVQISGEPTLVDDEVADHLVHVFGERIIVSDEQTVADPVAGETTSAAEAHVESAESESSSETPAESSEEPAPTSPVKRGKAKK